MATERQRAISPDPVEVEVNLPLIVGDNDDRHLQVMSGTTPLSLFWLNPVKSSQAASACGFLASEKSKP